MSDVRGTPILAIVGASDAPSQDTGRFTPAGLMAEATTYALDQTSLSKDDIDALFSASAYYYMPTLTLGEYLGVRPAFTDSTTIGGCSFVAHLNHAAAAIEAGRCEVGLIAFGSTQRSDGRARVRSMSEVIAYEVPYGPIWPIAGYALMAQRHMYEFGTTPEQLAEIAVAARGWALRNPSARPMGELTVQEVVDSPMICSPLHRYDCCLVSDGAGALLVTAPERAADLCEEPIYVLSAAEGHSARYMSALPDFTSTPAAETGPRALGHAGLALEDIDVFQIYDSFTIAVLMALEDLGFCSKGEGGPFVEDGRLRPGGSLPMNTNGGGLSYRHPGMLGMGLLLEAVTQLTGRGATRQVEDASTALVHALGGVHMSGATTILANRDAVSGVRRAARGRG